MNERRAMVSSNRRLGKVRLALLACVAAIGVLVAVLGWDVRKWFVRSGKPQPLVVYCAAALKAPVEELAQQYQQEYGIPVQLQFGASQTLLANAELSGIGDLYLPADDAYLQFAREKKLLAESLPLARMTAVLAVKKGNPLEIWSLDDLLDGEAKLAQANPDAAAIGKLTREALQSNGLWEKLEKRTAVFKGTVNDVANDIVLGTVDAGIVWDVTVKQYPDLEAVAIPLLAERPAFTAVGVLASSKQPTAALRFARYLAARDKGLTKMTAMGYDAIDGDLWTKTPELRLFAGAMLRPAIEKTVAAFEQREGVKVACIYNGCGNLVHQMEVERHDPDAFFACDLSFMQEVRTRFETPIEVSQNQLVILVPKKNPHQITKLADLAAPGLRIGVGHEKQCALGVLTGKSLTEAQLRDPIMKNVLEHGTQLPTGDMLVNELRLGALDVVIAYVSNAAEAGDELTAFKVDLPCALATQPFAVGKSSDHKYLTQRLLDALQTPESRQQFEELGFKWKATK